MRDAATVVNGEAPAAMALAAAMRGLPFVHISTDYVFDGSGKRPRKPHDPVAPLGAYGRSKLLGEAGVRVAGGSHVILRTSWVFSAHGSNFVKTMLRLGAERESLTVVQDQVGGPTPAADIADAVFPDCAARFAMGRAAAPIILQASRMSAGPTFAQAIMKAAGLRCVIKGIPSSDYPTPAKRPANSRLNCTSLQRDFGIKRPDWRYGLTQVIDELKGSR